MLECRHLSKTFKNYQAVEDISFCVRKGEVFALLGSNGAGKTTTIKMITGLLKKDSGEIQIEENTRVGYSPETPYFPPFLTGREVLFYYARIQKLKKKQIPDILSELLDTVGLEDNHTKIKHYSKGMLQRLAIAQSLLGDPQLLILDEPTAGLDALGRVEIMQLIQKLKADGKTILINSHILNDIERICDRGIIMKKGRIVGNWNRMEDHNGKSLEEIFIELVGRK